MKAVSMMTLVMAGWLCVGQSATWAQFKIAPPKGGLLGNQPQIIPGAAEKLKPFHPGNQPGPKPNPPNDNGQQHPPWWAPLANPNTWLGMARPGTRPGWRPGRQPTLPEYVPADPDWDSDWHPAPPPENQWHEPIELLNPGKNGVTIRCLIDGKMVELAPGEAKEIPAREKRIIRFHRGGEFGEARYGIGSGPYWFSRSEHGWELYRGPYHGDSHGASGSDLPSNQW